MSWLRVQILIPALATLLGSTLLGTACGPPIGPGDPGLQAYLSASHHLSDSEKSALLEGRPFLGMTLQEANYAMRTAGARRQPLGPGETARNFWVVYRARDGALWAVHFAGSPPLRAVEFMPYEGQTLPPPAPAP